MKYDGHSHCACRFRAIDNKISPKISIYICKNTIGSKRISVLGMSLNCSWWWGYTSIDLGSVEFRVIAHAPRSTLTRSSRIYLGAGCDTRSIFKRSSEISLSLDGCLTKAFKKPTVPNCLPKAGGRKTRRIHAFPKGSVKWNGNNLV